MNYNQRTTRIVAEEKTNKISRKRIDWDPQEERREIQPKWPGVYETEED